MHCRRLRRRFLGGVLLHSVHAFGPTSDADCCDVPHFRPHQRTLSKSGRPPPMHSVRQRSLRPELSRGLDVASATLPRTPNLRTAPGPSSAEPSSSALPETSKGLMEATLSPTPKCPFAAANTAQKASTTSWWEWAFGASKTVTSQPSRCPFASGGAVELPPGHPPVLPPGHPPVPTLYPA